MDMDKEICWLVTNNCNLKCQFCHSFSGYTEMNLPEIKSFVSKIKSLGEQKITLSGGEAFLHNHINEIVELLFDSGFIITIVTNGVSLGHFNPSNYLKVHEIVYSIDSIDDEINIKIGRGHSHVKMLTSNLEIARQINPLLSIRVNTVVNSVTLNAIDNVGETITNLNINKWRLFEFAPLRGLAKSNRDFFSISKYDFFSIVKKMQSKYPNINIQVRAEQDYESNYLLILPNGVFVKTINGHDVIVNYSF